MAKNKIKNLKVSSEAFSNEGDIPVKYTCDGEGINPSLQIDDVPEIAQTFAIIVEDPDAPSGIFDHWVVWNIPVENNFIPEDQNPGVSGTNSAGKTGYRPPCPPHGSHRYYFNIFALNDKLTIAAGSTKQELQEAMQPYLVAKGTLIGKYKR